MIAPRLEKLTVGMPIVFGGDRVTWVSEDLAASFTLGDSLLVMQDTGALLRIPAAVRALATEAVGRADQAFQRMGQVHEDQISAFFEAFAGRLADEAVWEAIRAANDRDVAAARTRGRSTTRLAVSQTMREDMISGLREWATTAGGRDRVIEQIDHEGWRLEQLTAPLGVVGFVFEGRPNVFADATGALRAGNTVVFRIGGDALATARAIMDAALDPALAQSGLPPGAVSLLESQDHAAGWAMFADPRLALAVARGSGPAVSQLGEIARQAGTPVSLHGTGGAWIVAGLAADRQRFAAAVYHSLDRKVCNTLNVCCIVRDRAPALVPAFLGALERAGQRRGGGVKLHVVRDEALILPDAWLRSTVRVRRAEGESDEPQVAFIDRDALGREWEWEDTPEVSLVIVESESEAADLFNRYSPRFAVSLISDDAAAQAGFFRAVNAPFVGDGFTRWVDGQYALNRPELGLSNWQNGRLLARSGVLAGDSLYTVRMRMRQTDLDLDRQSDFAGPDPHLQSEQQDVVRGSGPAQA